MSKRILLAGMAAIAGITSAHAQTQADGRVNTITTAVPFLRISPDARAGAMGDVGIATDPDANAQYWNIGKLPFATKQYGISVTYTPWLKDLVPDVFLAYISGYAKFGKDTNNTISGSMRYFSLGNINYTDNGIDPTGTGMPREYAFDAGYSRRLSPNLGVGVTLRYIHSALNSGVTSSPGTELNPGSTVAADVGVYYNKVKEIDEYRNNKFSFGATITNLGGKISYNDTRKDFIPINLGIGAAYGMQFDEYNKITFALDVNKLLVPTPQDTLNTATQQYVQYYPDKGVVSGVLGSFTDAPGGFKEELKEFDISIGAEYWYQNQFALRAGYFYEPATKGDRKYFTLGVGARYNVFDLSASYLVPSGSGTTRNPLSNTLRFTLSFAFDNLKGGDGSSSK